MTIRKFFTLTTILFAAFSFVSCSSDDDDNDDNNNNNKKDVVVDNHEYVDLGLPSGTLWATCNVGASKPEEFGDYFAWGETKTKRTYENTNYKWTNDDCETFSKYCTDSFYGNVDGNSELLPEDDAATANWGSDWCMPSKDQVNELINSDYTTIEQATLNGVDGWKVTSKKNEKTLFFPAAGIHYDTLWGVGYYGLYWSRSISDFMYAAHDLGLSSRGPDCGNNTRYSGFSVRPVRAKK